MMILRYKSWWFICSIFLPGGKLPSPPPLSKQLSAFREKLVKFLPLLSLSSGLEMKRKHFRRNFGQIQISQNYKFSFPSLFLQKLKIVLIHPKISRKYKHQQLRLNPTSRGFLKALILRQKALTQYININTAEARNVASDNAVPLQFFTVARFWGENLN